MYVTGSVLKLGHWHHVAIRYGTGFNNGLLNVYVDSVSITGGNVDGLYDGTGSRNLGIFDQNNNPAVGTALLAVSYTHLRSPRDATLSRMPSSA